MNEYRIELKLSELEEGLKDLQTGVDSLSTIVIPNDSLWDNTDIIRNWHVSPRTLATWRSKGLITFTKVGKKIFYDKTDRDTFIKTNKRNVKIFNENESILQN